MDIKTVPDCEAAHNDTALIQKVKAGMPEQKQLNGVAELFKVFGDVTRVKILYALLASPMCVCDIAAALDMTHSAISHQLRVLKNCRLVDYRRQGQKVIYSLADSHISTVLAQGMEHISE